MTISTSRARMHFVGKLCKLGALFIGVMGFIAILAIYIVSNASFGGPDGGPTLNNELTTLAITFLLAILVIFFCLILYAVGAFLVYLSPEKDAQQSAEQESDEAVEIISIPEVS